MIFYVIGLCIYGAFDFFELLESRDNSGINNKIENKTGEKLLFGLIFLFVLAIGIYYFSAYEPPSLTKSLIELKKLI